jgi:ubiquinone/menaquinone biosynthesis C-methylase UbiE
VSTEVTAGRRTYVPAAGYDWLLPLYDIFSRLIGAEAAHRQLVEQAEISPGQRVLEIGCGTGNLTVLVKRLHPGADVIGLDPDPKALARARRKAETARVVVRLDRGFSDALPYADASVDRVLSAFMLHHLTVDVKAQTLREVRRVLRQGGGFHVLDFGGAEDGLLARLFHRAHLEDQHRIPDLMRDAGFVAVAEHAERPTILGHLSYWGATG